MIKIFKKIVRKVYFTYKKIKLKNNNIFIDSNVYFNKTKFNGYNRIFKNTYVNHSTVGRFSYIGRDSILNNVSIGSFCSIAPYTVVIYGTHPTNFVSTHPIFYSTAKHCGISFVDKNKYKEFSYIGEDQKSVIIGNDVWIGHSVKIVEGVTIHDGAVVLAGSIVTKDVEAFSIVGGVPAKHIKYRFDSKTREKLLFLKWWEKDIGWIKKHSDDFLDIENFLNIIDDKLI